MALEDRFIYRPLRVGGFVGMGSDVSIPTADGETLYGRYLTQRTRGSTCSTCTAVAGI